MNLDLEQRNNLIPNHFQLSSSESKQGSFVEQKSRIRLNLYQDQNKHLKNLNAMKIIRQAKMKCNKKEKAE
jgi:hypothetical protein